MTQDFIAGIGETELHQLAWDRAGLSGQHRPTLADCTIPELTALAATQCTTDDGKRFTSRCTTLLSYLEGKITRGALTDSLSREIVGSKLSKSPRYEVKLS